MFSLEHIIWLILSVAIATSMFCIYKKFKLSFDTVVNIMLFISILSEVTKILCNMEPAPDGRTGMILDPGDLPFHLCSIQIFLLFILKFFIKTDTCREKMLGFMCPTMVIGAVMALLIPTVGVGFDIVVVYQYFIFHSSLIFFASYILKEKLVRWTVKTYFRNLAYLGGFALLCMWINSALSGVLPRVNFMYLVRPPMENLPIINIDHGWGVYILTLFALAVILVGIFHLAVTMPSYIKKKTADNSVKTN